MAADFTIPVAPVAPSVPPARQQAGETLDQRPWVKSRGCARPMVELVAGTGIYYRAQVLSVAQDQLLLYFASDQGPGRWEWVFRTSSRIVRKQYKSSEWKHKGQGAWALKSDTRNRHVKQRPKSQPRRKGRAEPGTYPVDSCC
jgi:hypothetical protein